MTDIANRAGVSRSAVSIVLNERRGEKIRIPDATRQKILEAASELGYRPNLLARSVASGKTRMIGYLVSEPDYEPHWNTVVGALSEAEKLGFTLKVLSVEIGTLEERVHQAIDLRLSGLIVRVIPDKTVLYEEALRAKIPVVTVDEGIVQSFGGSVVANDAPGCRAAIEHLIGLGHKRIAFISSGFPQLHNGAKDIGSAREELFRQAMQEQWLAVPQNYVAYETMYVYGSLAETEKGTASVREAFQTLVEHPQGRPTAIFCWRDETAMVVIDLCRQQGLRVPEDISVVGFSDLSAARFCAPPLSTVKSPWNELGRLAMRQVVHRIHEKFTTTPTIHTVDTSFVARQSTGPAPE